MANPQDVKKHRAAERDKMNQEQRQVAALEDIADTLESIRVVLLGMASAQGRQSGAR
jgi:hypothetical protein